MISTSTSCSAWRRGGGPPEPALLGGVAGIESVKGPQPHPRFTPVNNPGAGDYTTVVGPSGGGSVDPQAHAFGERRSALRALGREPVLPIFLRRASVPARTRFRPLVADAMAASSRRGAPRGSASGEPAGRPRHGRLGHQGPRAGRGRHYRPAQGGGPSDQPHARPKGQPRARYEFGCKVSIATPVTQTKGGQFVLRAKALHGNPFDGHTLKRAVIDIEKNPGLEVTRIHVDRGYRGHPYPNRFRVFVT